MKLVEASWNTADVRGTFLRHRVRIQNDLSIVKLSVLKEVLFLLHISLCKSGILSAGMKTSVVDGKPLHFWCIFWALDVDLVQRGDSSYAGSAMLSAWMRTLLLWKYSVQYQPLEVVVEKDLHLVVDKDLATFGPGLKR